MQQPYLLRFPDIKKATGLSRTTIWRLERNGQFPKRRKLSTHSVGWLREEFEDWAKTRELVNQENSHV